MGQAKARGTYEQRKALAIAEGRRPVGDVRRELTERLREQEAQARTVAGAMFGGRFAEGMMHMKATALTRAELLGLRRHHGKSVPK